MAFPTYGIETVFNFVLGNAAEAKVVLHQELSPHADPTNSNLNAVATAAADWWNNAHGAIQSGKGQFNSSVSLTSVVSTARGLTPQLQAIVPVGTSGSLSGNPLPPETAIVTTWYTGTPGRSYRGRSFWPMLQYNVLNTAGELPAATATALGVVFAELRTLIEAAVPGVLVAVYSPTLGIMTPVSASSPVVRTIPHHQRRRNH